MNEKILTPQELKSKQEQEDAKLLADYLARHPEPVISQENLREAEPEIAQFENIIALFESTHSLEDLHLIIDLTPQEAPKNAIREPARVALIPIIALLNTLKKKTNISTEKYEELKEKCRRLSRAVGMINNNKVDHNR
ncbi:hypothetical protein A3G98_00895 [Candidatus Nomurabacteria bacterium RIFCSPLOWO2_12_FULL_37_8]|uniref:Uncharacterized protein n=1 Tax=Candidatus Nomurabacteria bacterium RIFCSPLOWO2_12_FULL_37_8 TaxID=1801793 RepID=A0A1F6Y542_9BACT|nr:MAG: hypothetical protein A3G98_00895 [Candidatus Nomurabacteria bacterium RIFCSPLOWO2_12_FULL_37_8]